MGKLKLGVKLIFYITVLLVLSMIIIGVLTFYRSKTELLNKVSEKLHVINTQKINHIDEYMGDVKSCFNIIEKDKELILSINSYINTINTIHNSDTAYRKHRFAEDYIRKRLSSLKEAFGLSRIMIITPKGRKVWESNIVHYLETFDSEHFNPGSKLFINAKHQLSYSDIYQPRFHESEFYMTVLSPLKHQNNITMGVIACEMNLKPMFEMITDTTGLGETGETFLTKRISSKKVLVLSPLRTKNDAALKMSIEMGQDKGQAAQFSVSDVHDNFKSEIIDYSGNSVDISHSFINELGWGVVTKINHGESFKAIDDLRHWIIFICSAIIFFAIIIIAIFVKRFLKPIIDIRDSMISLAEGDFPKEIEYDNYDEIFDTTEAMNEFVDRLKVSTNFAERIGRGELINEKDEIKLGADVLSKSLKAMKSNLTKVEEDNEKRKWAVEGIAIHGEVLRNNSSDIEKLGRSFISSLVDYVDAQHGGLFVLQEIVENTEPSYELISTYAYDSENVTNTVYKIGQGLIGQCAKEKETIALKNVPNDFTKISSGLGSSVASYVLIVPLKLHGQVYGVLEIASFNLFDSYKVDFIEKLGESVASSILAVKSSEQTQKLLIESQLITDNLRSKEDDLKKHQFKIEEEQELLKEEFKKAQNIIQKLKKDKRALEKEMNELKNKND